MMLLNLLCKISNQNWLIPLTEVYGQPEQKSQVVFDKVHQNSKYIDRSRHVHPKHHVFPHCFIAKISVFKQDYANQQATNVVNGYRKPGFKGSVVGFKALRYFKGITFWNVEVFYYFLYAVHGMSFVNLVKDAKQCIPKHQRAYSVDALNREYGNWQDDKQPKTCFYKNWFIHCQKYQLLIEHSDRTVYECGV